VGDVEFWSVQLFVDELNNLTTKLGVDEYDLLGHSWGGMLAAEVAIRQPPGLKKLVLASSPASMILFVEAQNVFRSKLPEDIRKVLDKFEEDGIDTPEYQAAVQFYYARHLCLISPMPEGLTKAFGWIEKDPTVYLTM
jgi:L-proline amide hydrolase